MTVIALTQEMGSARQDVAEQVARDLGLPSCGTRSWTTCRPDARAHQPDQPLREGKAGTIERLRTDRASLAVYMSEEVLEVAARGNVVLRGWGATCLLRPVPHVVCVRVTRPFAKRVAWLHGTPRHRPTSTSPRPRSGAATARTRRACTRSSASPGDPLLYDLVLNTDRLWSRAARCRLRRWRDGPSSPRPRHRARCCKPRARCPRSRGAADDEATREVDVTVNSDAGRVVLSGIVLDADEMPAAERVARPCRASPTSTTSCA